WAMASLADNASSPNRLSAGLPGASGAGRQSGAGPAIAAPSLPCPCTPPSPRPCAHINPCYTRPAIPPTMAAAMTPVITRSAPTPTGYLHIGGARTALFSWAFAMNQGGKMLLRIEDTDRERSTEAAVTALVDGLKWLGLHWE